MLKKLIRHEFKATRRFFLPAYAIFAALLIVERLSLLTVPVFEENEGFLSAIAGITTGLITTVTIIGLIALMAAPAIYAIVRFYRNMLGDEGYLTFTLPVTTGQLIWSKLLVAVFWELLTGLVVILVGGVFLISLSFDDFLYLFDMVCELSGVIWNAVGVWAVILIVSFLIAMICQMFTQMLTLYTCMSIGQTAGSHRLLVSAGCYVGINFITSWLIQIPLSVLTILLGGEMFTEFNMTMTNAMNNGEYALFCQLFVGLILFATLFNLLLGALHFFLTRFFLTKKLNLA